MKIQIFSILWITWLVVCEATKIPMEKTSWEAAEISAEETSVEAAEIPASMEAAESSTEETSMEAAEIPTEETSMEAANIPTEETSMEAANIPTEETSMEAAEIPTEETSMEAANIPTEQTSMEAAEIPTEETSMEAANIPTEETIAEAAIGNEDSEMAGLVRNGMTEIADKSNLPVDRKEFYEQYELIFRRRKRAIFRDCKDAYGKGYRSNGVYKIRPDTSSAAFQVYCDMTTDGGGWTVIQRRKDGSVNFYRGWDEYEHGFGNIYGELFLGLENIHKLTASSGSQLRVDLEDFSGGRAYATYNLFSVGNSGTSYTLAVSGYSGTAGDSLWYHAGMKFSTYDRDNDLSSSHHCAQFTKGAWWHNSCNHSNLNGAYLGNVANHEGVGWYFWKNNWSSLKGAVMMVRRK